jgi:pSer/pThr/pTyr-binding forkhead associated (FHA) protein
MTSSLDKKNGKRCSNCGFENHAEAINCAQCDIWLDAPTTVAAPAIAAIGVLEPLAQPLALTVNEVLFLVAGLRDSITITLAPDKRRLAIGRGVGDEDLLNLDLSGIGTAAGISRSHALLDFDGEHPTITDLKSTNGTWVNEDRLPPDQPRQFRTGDLLRLGQQYVFVYFSTGASVVEIISLSEHEPETSQFTPDLLVNHFGGYLQTLSKIQEILDQVLKQSPLPVTINDINVSKAPQRIKIRVTGASTAISLMIDVIVPWRESHQNDLRTSTQAEGGEFSRELSLLIQTKLEALAPDLVEPERASYVQHLLPYIQTLALHSLDLNREKNW